jgi:L-threonylcarbamoyladenylate synthase
MSDNFEEIRDVLEHGGVILFPTDTIWGLGCDVLNTDAIEKIYTIKNRPRNKPFIILVSDIEMLKEYIVDIHPRIETLLLYHKRPLTIIYKKGKKLPSILTKKSSVAIRIVQEKVIADFIRAYGKPLVSSSANIAGKPFPETFLEISTVVKNAVDYIFKYKQTDTSTSQPSIIATFNKKGKLKFLR